MPTPAVAIQNINKIFGEGAANQVQALKEINLTIQPNEFISLISPSVAASQPCCVSSAI
ncbi:MAG: hypothetical protein U0401_28135 [Anaerolineae bacterium]